MFKCQHLKTINLLEIKYLGYDKVVNFGVNLIGELLTFQ